MALLVAREYPVLDVHELHDGDTWRLIIDTGFEHAAFPWLRLKGWSAPELDEPGGPEALVAAESVLHDALPGGLWVRTYKRTGYEDMKKSFARYLAEVYLGKFETRDLSVDLGSLLEASGHVVRTS